MSQSDGSLEVAIDEALSARVLALTAEVEAALADGRALSISAPAAQALLAAGARVYAATTEAGAGYQAVNQRNGVTPTDIMITASGLLKSADLAVFELGMWQGWTGR